MSWFTQTILKETLCSLVCRDPWRTRLCFQWPARLRDGSKVDPCTESESPTASHQRPTHHWPLWTCPAKDNHVASDFSFPLSRLLFFVLCCCSPAGCSPRTSSGLAAQRGPGSCSSPLCRDSDSCQNQQSWWCNSYPPGSCALPDPDVQS